MLHNHLVFFRLTVNKLNGHVFRAQVVRAYPRSHINSFAQAQLTIAPTLRVKRKSAPRLPHPVLPGSKNTCLFVAVLLDAYALLDRRDIEARRIFFDHAAHAEHRRAGSYRLFHHSNPAVRNTITSPLVVRRNDIALEQLVEREAIRFILHIRVVVFALFADCPAVLAIVALGPSAGCALPAKMICTGRLGSFTMRCRRSGSRKMSVARLYVAKRRAKPIIKESGFSMPSNSAIWSAPSPRRR